MALAWYLVAVFVGGALLAPWLYAGVQALAPHVPALESLARKGFGRYVNRGVLITALLGLPLFLRAAGVRSLRDVGLYARGIPWRRVAGGFALGFFSLAAVCAVALLAGGRRLNLERTAGELAAQFAGALLTAAVVSVIEEMLFRGAIFGGLRRALPWGAALAISSALYGIVHFMTRPVSPERVDWLAGLRVLPTMLRGMADPDQLVPAFFSLTLAGVVLGLAYHRTGDIFASIGIHAGWIFWLKFYGALTRSVPGADPHVWGTRKLVDGWLAFAALVLVLGVVWLLSRRHRATTPRAIHVGPSADSSS
ncbi:MAG TPA: CPBP family intramembrane glutamic endopeptidase [Longimicrobium sp.]|nr:CPBP family intramembrane glutamic endopeptidase [Longimicrobium sp.]